MRQSHVRLWDNCMYLLLVITRLLPCFGHFNSVLGRDLIVHCGHWTMWTKEISCIPGNFQFNYKISRDTLNDRKTTLFHGAKMTLSQIFQNYFFPRSTPVTGLTRLAREAWAYFSSGSSVPMTPLRQEKLLKSLEVKGAVAGMWPHQHLRDTWYQRQVSFLPSPRGQQVLDKQDPCQGLVAVLVV